VALPLALGDNSGIATLTLRDPVAGASALFPLSGRGDGPTASCLVERLDAIAGLPDPTHIKVDVDGGQRAVLAGAGETLAKVSLREVLIEMFHSEATEIDGLLAGHGFRRDAAPRRPGGDGDAVGNVIYRRGL
jgi:Methyltransferase FkbM domain